MSKDGRRGPGRAYSIDKHPQRKEIIQDLINQMPYLTVSQRYPGLSESAVHRYATQKLRKKASSALLDGHYEGAALLERVEDTIFYVQKMYESIDAYLRDPTDPNRYDLSARAEEIDVIYTKYLFDEDGKVADKIRQRAPLQILLDRALQDFEISTMLIDTRKVDIRKLLIETAATLTKQLEVLAKIAGVVKEVSKTTVNTSVTINHQVITNIVSVIEREVKDPEVVKRIVEALHEQ